MVAEDSKEVKEEGDNKAVNDVDKKELHDTGSRGLAGRGEICGSINRGLIYAGKPLNPDPPKNESVTTVPQSAAYCHGVSRVLSFANYAEENEVVLSDVVESCKMTSEHWQLPIIQFQSFFFDHR